jgi:hypothetical protein
MGQQLNNNTFLITRCYYEIENGNIAQYDNQNYKFKALN